MVQTDRPTKDDKVKCKMKNLSDATARQNQQTSILIKPASDGENCPGLEQAPFQKSSANICNVVAFQEAKRLLVHSLKNSI